MSVARFSEDTSFSIELNSLTKSSPVRYTVTLIKRMVRVHEIDLYPEMAGLGDGKINGRNRNW